MDFRNLCSKIDVDSIRAKLPPLPSALSELKFPKSMPKLKGRKIFRMSRDDVSTMGRQSSGKSIPDSEYNISPARLQTQHHTMSPSGLINHTPVRISTISSLMNEQDGRKKGRHDSGTYRNAGGIDDYYPSPLNERFQRRVSQPISPIKAPSIQSETRVADTKLSLKEQLEKTYKDITEFRLKHIFAKKTVVRNDKIEINHYIRNYNDDRRKDERRQEKLDRQIAENYNFSFKESRQKSTESLNVTPPDSPIMKKKMQTPKYNEQSSDESGMEYSPPNRKAGIAATRFARVKSPPMEMPLEVDIDEDGNDDNDDDIELDIDEEAAVTQKAKQQEQLTKTTNKNRENRKSIKEPSEKKRRAPLSPQQTEDKEAEQQTRTPEKSEKPFDIIKTNIKRIHKSMRNPNTQAPVSGQSAADTDEEAEAKPKLSRTKQLTQRFKRAAAAETDEEGEVEKPKISRTKQLTQRFKRATAAAETDEEGEGEPKMSRAKQLTQRLKKFTSTDNIDKSQETDGEAAPESPLHKLSNKLQDWKKSFRRNKQESQCADDEDSPQHRDKPIGSLMKKLKHIRARKQNSADDPDDDEEGGMSYKESFRSRAKLQLEKGMVAASQLPEMTMEKLKESKKYFKKSTNAEAENKTTEKTTKPKTIAEKEVDEEDLDMDDYDDDERKEKKPQLKTKPKARHYAGYDSDEEDNEEEEEDEDEEERQAELKKLDPAVRVTKDKSQLIARAAWATSPISDSMDTGDENYDGDFPRLLIHQDNTDMYESTLIIAVTRPRSQCSSAIITELPPDSPKVSTPETKADDWVPNKQIIAGFLKAKPAPPERPKTLWHQTKEEAKKEEDNEDEDEEDDDDDDELEARTPRGPSRVPSMELDSDSDDSWAKQANNRRSSTPCSSLKSANDNAEEDAWQVRKSNSKDEKLYKAKSIDIFEKNSKDGITLDAFEDFDLELKNQPVLKIKKQKEFTEVEINLTRCSQSFERDSSEDLDAADDDNSSRVTKIFKQSSPEKPNYNSAKTEFKLQKYGNSRESLNGNLDEHEEAEAAHNNDDSDSDRPPSEAPPSPPPARSSPTIRPPPPSQSPPPPPLPERQPSLRLSKLQQADALTTIQSALSKPPLPPNRPTVRPPQIPERTPSMSCISKPLVKTSSLRLAYSEQVNPKDVGKVNKLISRFEPDAAAATTTANLRQRPRIIPRKPFMTNESDEYSEDEEEEEEDHTRARDDKTPTNNFSLQKSYSINSEDSDGLENCNVIQQTKLKRSQSSNNNNNSSSSAIIPSISISATNNLDSNFNLSQPNSEYGSPLPYPSSLVGSTDVTPLASPKERDSFLLNTRRSRRSRRSMTRDDEHFYSFDSDEENSYYSISSNHSSRIVEL